MKGKPTLGVKLTDVQVGGHVVSIQTQAVVAKGEKGKGAKKMLGGARSARRSARIADGGPGAAIGAGVGARAGGRGDRGVARRTRRAWPRSRSSRSRWPYRSRCRR